MDRRVSNPVFNDRKLKLGTFCTNAVPNITFVPEVLHPTWANALAMARMADEGGLEAIVPIARWKGYLDGKPNHPANDVLDAFPGGRAWQRPRATRPYSPHLTRPLHTLLWWQDNRRPLTQFPAGASH